MAFLYRRKIYFKDTDAAGVVYFANVLSMCHEAYEASLQASGINLRTFFGDRHRAIPIVHGSVDFFQPMFCGETYTIDMVPTLVKPSEFSITYQVYSHLELNEQASAKACSRHVCIDPSTRRRLPLDNDMMSWLTQYNS
ncbi:MAG: thioesterase family protein [Cyanobacteria bacterium P01_F01_bin.150]